jgi:hypothetical protein
MSIKLVLLKSGEDVIADVTEMTVGEHNAVVGYFLNNPCSVKVLSNQGEHKMKINAWMPLTKDKSIPVPADWVVTIVEPIDQLLSLYTDSIKKHGEPEDSGVIEPDVVESD